MKVDLSSLDTGWRQKHLWIRNQQIFANSPVELSDVANEELSIYLAQHRDDVLVALLAKKPASKAVKETVKKPTAKTTEKPAKKTSAAPKLSEAS